MVIKSHPTSAICFCYCLEDMTSWPGSGNSLPQRPITNQQSLRGPSIRCVMACPGRKRAGSSTSRRQPFGTTLLDPWRVGTSVAFGPEPTLGWALMTRQPWWGIWNIWEIVGSPLIGPWLDCLWKKKWQERSNGRKGAILRLDQQVSKAKQKNNHTKNCPSTGFCWQML